MCPQNPNSYVEALNPNVAVFGDRATVEVIKVKQGHKGGALIQKNWSLCKRKRYHSVGSTPQPAYAHRKGHVRTQQEGDCLQARKSSLTKHYIC